MGALEIGWRVDLPVYACPGRDPIDSGETTYHFVLTYPCTQALAVVGVPDGPEVQSLLRDQNWPVSARR